MFYFRFRRDGRTRLVFVVGPVALKFARGPRGRRSNLFEADLYTRVSERRRAMLCPILWSAPYGILLVSRAACPISEEETNNLKKTNGFPEWDWEPDSPDNNGPFEHKASDWGRLDGRLVSLDYAAPVLFVDDPE
jgi:hypothetical protein